jgi:hypothetical protein
MADDGLAAGFDDTGADEQMLFAELGIVHASRIFDKVVGFAADFLRLIGIRGLNRTKGGDKFRDLAFVEPALMMETDPGVTTFRVVSPTFAVGESFQLKTGWCGGKSFAINKTFPCVRVVQTYPLFIP